MSVKNPHIAVILLSNCEVHEKLSTGECGGVPVSKEKLKEYGIEFPTVINVEGFDLHDCLVKLKNRLKGLKNDV